MAEIKPEWEDGQTLLDRLGQSKMPVLPPEAVIENYELIPADMGIMIGIPCNFGMVHSEFMESFIPMMLAALASQENACQSIGCLTSCRSTRQGRGVCLRLWDAVLVDIAPSSGVLATWQQATSAAFFAAASLKPIQAFGGMSNSAILPRHFLPRPH